MQIMVLFCRTMSNRNDLFYSFCWIQFLDAFKKKYLDFYVFRFAEIISI